MNDISSKLIAIIAEVLEIEEETIIENTSIKELSDIDSVAILEILSTTERIFKIQFSEKEIQSLDVIKELVDMIEKKVSDIK